MLRVQVLPPSLEAAMSSPAPPPNSHRSCSQIPTKVCELVGFTAIEPSTSPFVARISSGVVATVQPLGKGDVPDTRTGLGTGGGGGGGALAPPQPTLRNATITANKAETCVLRRNVIPIEL